jgi:hypothetical protein
MSQYKTQITPLNIDNFKFLCTAGTIFRNFSLISHSLQRLTSLVSNLRQVIYKCVTPNELLDME